MANAKTLAAWLLISAAVAALAPTRADAQVTGSVNGTVAFESNSNVFDLESGFAAPPSGTTKRSDTDLSYGAGFDVNYLWGRQQLYAKANATEYRYQTFTELDNVGYQFDLGMKWKLGEIFDGKLDVARTRSMVPFLDLTGQAVQSLSLSTSQTETAEFGVLVTSAWKLDGTVSNNKTGEPIAGAPNLQLTETSGTGSILYQGFAGLSSGFTAGYSSGSYDGAIGLNNPTYGQYTAGLTATYIHYRATFGGQIGYSRRQSDTGTDNTSGLTGALDLKYALTPKTSVNASVSRAINSYFLTTGSEIDTLASAGVNWQATYKVSVYAGYSFTYRDYPGQGPNTVTGDRVDIQEYANAYINYQPKLWLSFKTYANVQTRRSTFSGGDFNSTVFGISATVTPYRRAK